MKVGIISDTHDLLRPEVISRLRGVDQIPKQFRFLRLKWKQSFSVLIC